MKYPPKTQALAPVAPLFDGTQACSGVDIKVFFPPQGGNAKKAIAAAKDVCSACPFVAPCLEYAMTTQGTSGIYLDGVWGHTTARERAAIRKRRVSPDFFQDAA